MFIYAFLYAFFFFLPSAILNNDRRSVGMVDQEVEPSIRTLPGIYMLSIVGLNLIGIEAEILPWETTQSSFSLNERIRGQLYIQPFLLTTHVLKHSR
ncbi:hypothetical protein B0T19DRAFT_19300 [Cercophora scortea]|uniref:Uncharacterized protein n=1 Tax=Cercophora scortea TaxID=314031 RepID=A0AAE0J3F7_9PEZI|nr:hypothetical protein B0T19DRAFT_19300 [Cercophora scortea]